MADWSLEVILSSLHEDIQRRLSADRAAFAHPVSKGDASEKIWLELLQTYLPEHYQVAKAFVVDSEGRFSDQIDVVAFDRQYSPVIFNYEGEIIIPAESVCVVFEAIVARDIVDLLSQRRGNIGLELLRHMAWCRQSVHRDEKRAHHRRISGFERSHDDRIIIRSRCGGAALPLGGRRDGRAGLGIAFHGRDVPLHGRVIPDRPAGEPTDRSAQAALARRVGKSMSVSAMWLR